MQSFWLVTVLTLGAIEFAAILYLRGGFERYRREAKLILGTVFVLLILVYAFTKKPESMVRSQLPAPLANLLANPHG